MFLLKWVIPPVSQGWFEGCSGGAVIGRWIVDKAWRRHSVVAEECGYYSTSRIRLYPCSVRRRLARVVGIRQ